MSVKTKIFVIVSALVLVAFYFWLTGGVLHRQSVQLTPVVQATDAQFFAVAPPNLPVDKTASASSFTQSFQTGAIQYTYQYNSTKTVAAAYADYSKYFGGSAWTTSVLANTDNGKSLRATSGGETAIVTVAVEPVSNKVVVSMVLTEPLLTDYPKDFPSGANVQTSKKNIEGGLEYLRSYATTGKVKDAYTVLKTYLGNNGWSIQSDTAANSATHAVTAVKANAVLYWTVATQGSGIKVDQRLDLQLPAN